MLHFLFDTLFILANTNDNIGNDAKIVKLKALTTINAGYPFRGRIEESSNSPVLAVQMKDVSEYGEILWAMCTPTDLPGKKVPTWLGSGDILIAAKGSRNYAVEVQDIPDGYKAVAAPHFFVIRCATSALLPGFLVWQLNQSPCQRYFEQNAEGSLTKSIRRNVLEDTEIASPPIEKQQSIVSLANTLQQEQQILERLVHNNESLMNTIVADLLNHKECRS